MIKLKKCPFCGGAVRMFTSKNIDMTSMISEFDYFNHSIECEECSAEMRRYDSGENFPQIIIDQWNNRTNEQT